MADFAAGSGSLMADFAAASGSLMAGFAAASGSVAADLVAGNGALCADLAAGSGSLSADFAIPDGSFGPRLRPVPARRASTSRSGRAHRQRSVAARDRPPAARAPDPTGPRPARRPPRAAGDPTRAAGRTRGRVVQPGLRRQLPGHLGHPDQGRLARIRGRAGYPGRRPTRPRPKSRSSSASTDRSPPSAKRLPASSPGPVMALSGRPDGDRAQSARPGARLQRLRRLCVSAVANGPQCAGQDRRGALR